MLADETVFSPDAIPGERPFVEQMPKPLLENWILRLVIHHTQESIDDSECVPRIVPGFGLVNDLDGFVSAEVGLDGIEGMAAKMLGRQTSGRVLVSF